MSVDYNAVCDSCKIKVHAGQRMGGIPSFGYGSDQIGSHVATADWIYEHSYHGSGVRIEVMDTKGDRPSDDYQRVELEDWKRDPVTGRWRPKELA